MEINSAFLLQNSLSSSSFAGTLVSGDLPRVLLQKVPPARPIKLSSSNSYVKGLYFRSKHTSISLGPSTVSTMAVRSNANIDTDDQFDEMFKKYGKIVYTNNDKKSSAAEIDDDAESLSFAVAAAKVASDVKAEDIRLLFVKPLVYWTGFFIIATAFSRPQIDAIGSKIRDLAEKEYGRVASGDLKPNSWTLLDFGDVVVHIFLPEQRAFYNLEEFYGNATPIKLPFDNQNSRSSNRMLNNSSMP